MRGRLPFYIIILFLFGDEQSISEFELNPYEQINDVTYVCRLWLTLSNWRSLRMAGRFVLRLWLKEFTSECHILVLEASCHHPQPSNELLSFVVAVTIMWSSSASKFWNIRSSSGEEEETVVLRVWFCDLTCPGLFCRHAGLSAAQQQLIRETLMKWLQYQVGQLESLPPSSTALTCSIFLMFFVCFCLHICGGLVQRLTKNKPFSFICNFWYCSKLSFHMHRWVRVNVSFNPLDSLI